ncbi:MAG: DUF4276 family protein [Planctomycetota bacterium]
MSVSAIVPIVEGHSEVQSVPLLVRRILHDCLQVHDIDVARPFRVKRNRVVKEGVLERAVQQALRDRDSARCVLVLLDADDDCPGELGPSLSERCREATTLPTAVVLANRELEAWFLGAKESLRGTRGIRDDACAPENPESIRGAKERLTGNMVDRRYLAVDDQAALAERMDIAAARRRCPSFDKLVRDVERLVHDVLGGGARE